MTVNLTINDISAKEAMELLQLAQKFDCTNDTVKPTIVESMKGFKTAVDSMTEKVSETKTEPEKPKAEKTAIKIEDVRAAFAKFAKANGKDAAKEILTKFNATKVTELREEDYGAVMLALGEE